MEVENAPLEKEKHLQTTNFGFHVSFWGCMSLCSLSIQAVGKLFEALLSITACGQGKLGGEPDMKML